MSIPVLLKHIIKLDMLSRHELIIDTKHNNFMIKLYGKYNHKVCVTYNSENDARREYRTLNEAIDTNKDTWAIEWESDISEFD